MSQAQAVQTVAGEKITETATHIYFLTGPFSQWHRSDFKQTLFKGGFDLQFNCAEQYMMAGKAVTCGDYEILEKVMNVQYVGGDWRRVPEAQKKLGRQIANFNKEAWDRDARPVVFRGNFSKFTQNAHLRDYILNSGDKYLVEGASYDDVWGVKLAWDNPLILDSKNWRGTNWLGQSLMATRIAMHYCHEQGMQYSDLDIWDAALVQSFFDQIPPA
jgi:ribA/ribD-fused uncharacterized protein